MKKSICIFLAFTFLLYLCSCTTGIYSVVVGDDSQNSAESDNHEYAQWHMFSEDNHVVFQRECTHCGKIEKCVNSLPGFLKGSPDWKCLAEVNDFCFKEVFDKLNEELIKQSEESGQDLGYLITIGMKGKYVFIHAVLQDSGWFPSRFTWIIDTEADVFLFPENEYDFYRSLFNFQEDDWFYAIKEELFQKSVSGYTVEHDAEYFRNLEYSSYYETEDGMSSYEGCYFQTISESNIKASHFFIYSDGCVGLVYKWYSLTDAPYYEYEIKTGIN